MPERDLKMLTGIYVPHSTQHRLLERYELLLAASY
jgi:hypothetical protein